MSWSDNDIDQLFRDAEAQQEFSYDQGFFQDIERQLPVNRSRRSLLWWTSSFMMLGLFSLLFVTRMADDQLNASINVLVVSKNTKSASENKSTQQPSRQTDLVGTIAPEPGVIPVLDKEELTVTPNKLPERVDSYESATTYVSDISQLETVSLPSSRISDGELLAGNNLKLAKGLRKTWFISLDGAMQHSWTDESTGTRMNGGAAVSTGMDLHLGRWVLGAGVSFAWKNLNHLEIRERTKIYGFGYSTYDNAYSFTGIASLHVPLKVAYQTGRSQFGFGIEAGRNLFATMRRVQSMNGEVFRMTQGITDVSLLGKYSLQPEVSFSYQINEQIAVGTSLKYQVLHPLSSDRFEGVQKQHPWTFGASIKATITK